MSFHQIEQFQFANWINLVVATTRDSSRKFLAKICSYFLLDLTESEVDWLVDPSMQSQLLGAKRLIVIYSRVRMLATMFAILTPLWIVVDFCVFPGLVSLPLAVFRLYASLSFYMLVKFIMPPTSLAGAHRTLASLLAIPTCFSVITFFFLRQFELDGVGGAAAYVYTFLPFVIIAGLGIFPLAAAESAIYIGSLLIIQALTFLFDPFRPSITSFVVSGWLLLVISMVSGLCGLSQLAFMIALVRENVRDGLTQCFTRRSGEEMLQLQFKQLLRQDAFLSIAFIDLDNFKQVNDLFGHDAGDAVLAFAAKQMQQSLRSSDNVIRWGGEEFVVVLPATSLDQTKKAIDRLIDAGLGVRPDGTPMTASIGIAEYKQDQCTSLEDVIAKADQRMYYAKRSGKNQIISEEQI